MAHLCAKSREDPTKNEEKLMFPTAEFYKKDGSLDRKSINFTGRLRWSDVRDALLYVGSLLLRLVLLLRYLNPIQFIWNRARKPAITFPDLSAVYNPTYRERIRNYFKSGMYKFVYPCISIAIL